MIRLQGISSGVINAPILKTGKKVENQKITDTLLGENQNEKSGKTVGQLIIPRSHNKRDYEEDVEW
jgi:hypothetical protein